MPMNSDNYAKELEKYKKAPRTNEWKAQTPSASLYLKIPPKTEENKFGTPWLYVRSKLKRRIPIGHTSPSLVSKFDTQAI